jgi:hypothetical protein
MKIKNREYNRLTPVNIAHVLSPVAAPTNVRSILLDRRLHQEAPAYMKIKNREYNRLSHPSGVSDHVAHVLSPAAAAPTNIWKIQLDTTRLL